MCRIGGLHLLEGIVRYLKRSRYSYLSREREREEDTTQCDI